MTTDTSLPTAPASRATSIATIPRSAGIGLLVHVAGITAAMWFSGTPGGDYEDSMVTGYTATSHYVPAMALWYVAALTGLAVVFFGAGLRRLPGGRQLSAIVSIGAATGVAGAWVAGGVEVAMAEGGHAVRAGVPHPVVYLITEIGILLAVCGPALCVGVVALVLSRHRGLPTWLRVFSVVGGVCGILAPFFFTYFVYVLWAAAAGITLAVRERTVPEPPPATT